MNTSLLPRTFRALAVTAILTSSALAQAPAPATPAAPGATPAAPAATPPPKPLSPTEKTMVKNVGKSLNYQMKLAEAGKNAAVTDENLVRFRDTSLRDLTKTWTGLTKLAAARGETLSQELVGSDKSDVERLAKLKDDKFIKQWVEDLSKEAKKLDKDFESGARSAQDPDLKMFFANYSPLVKGYFNAAESAEKNLKKK